MNISDIRGEIESTASPRGHAYWRGAGQDAKNQLIILAQRKGTTAAIAELEELASHVCSTCLGDPSVDCPDCDASK